MTSVVPPPPDTTTPSAAELERDYLLQNYARYPPTLARGKGCYVYDTQGQRYLDFITGIGVSALGHAHPRMTKVIREQAGLLIHSSNLYYHEYQGRLAKRLVEMSGLQRVFFSNTGTESVEGALQIAMAYTGRGKFLSIEESYHGNSLATMSIGASHNRETYKNLLPNCHKIEPPLDHKALGKVETLLKKRDVAAFRYNGGAQFTGQERARHALDDRAPEQAAGAWHREQGGNAAGPG